MLIKGQRLSLAAATVAALVLSTTVASTAASTAGESAVEAATPVRTALGGWVGTWQTAPAAGVDNTANGYANFSIRNVVHTSVGGNAARVRLSNAFGKAPLPLSATVAAA